MKSTTDRIETVVRNNEFVVGVGGEAEYLITESQLVYLTSVTRAAERVMAAGDFRVTPATKDLREALDTNVTT